MAHIHLAWELGGGLGHAGRLRMLARAAQARGHRVSIALRDLVHTHQLLADLDAPLFQAPLWVHQTVGLPPNPGNLAEIVRMSGYLNPATLRGLVAGWRALLQQLQPDLVLCDYAPTAILAARSLGLPSASAGSGFYSPPPGRPLPPLRDWENLPPERLRQSEAQVLATANAVLSGHGAAPFGWCAELFLGDLPLLCSWPELDHYGRADAGGDAGIEGGFEAVLEAGIVAASWRGPVFLPQGGAAPVWPSGDGAKVFAYLKTGHPDHEALLRALVARGCRTLCYLPEVAGGRAPPVVSRLLHYARQPVSLDAALAQADLCVCHGGEATLAQALLAGVPVLLLPSQIEQFLAARRVAQAGAGINAAVLSRPVEWGAQLARLLDQPSFAVAARNFAERHRGFDQHRLALELIAACEGLIGVGVRRQQG